MSNTATDGRKAKKPLAAGNGGDDVTMPAMPGPAAGELASFVTTLE
jgi:hypothetical protein